MRLRRYSRVFVFWAAHSFHIFRVRELQRGPPLLGVQYALFNVLQDQRRLPVIFCLKRNVDDCSYDTRSHLYIILLYDTLYSGVVRNHVAHLFYVGIYIVYTVYLLLRRGNWYNSCVYLECANVYTQHILARNIFYIIKIRAALVYSTWCRGV